MTVLGEEFRRRVAAVFRSEPNRDIELADDEWWTGYLEALIHASERHRLLYLPPHSPELQPALIRSTTLFP